MVEVYVDKLHSNSNSEVFTLVLKELNGVNEIPVNIGKYEAFNLLTILKNSNQIKPTTHQLFTEFIVNSNVKMVKVVIVFYSINLDLFTSVIYFEKENGDQFTLNSRLSDAVALAVNNNSKIYCEESVIEKVSINNTKFFSKNSNSINNTYYKAFYNNPISNTNNGLISLSTEELNDKINLAVKEENYDLAAKYRDERNKRINYEDKK
ncbi:MAG: bifunctional nuclease domain-containing protein [Bacteroidales bacterium]|jgi:bifunctional DNase/RNase